jgi:hypothetical protein
VLEVPLTCVPHDGIEVLGRLPHTIILILALVTS